MTTRTHDLGAFTGLVLALVYFPVTSVTLGTTVVALGANLLGATFPDLDQPTAEFWYRLPAGSILGRLVKPLLGGHRLISHSLVGFVLVGFGLRYVLEVVSHTLLVNMDVVWAAFMIGYASHLILDTFTKEGVPWLFPLPFRFGFPPLKFLRITTGGMIEKGVIFPGLLILNGYLIYQNYGEFLDFLKHYIH